MLLVILHIVTQLQYIVLMVVELQVWLCGDHVMAQE